jgi:PKD repeat protein
MMKNRLIVPILIFFLVVLTGFADADANPETITNPGVVAENTHITIKSGETLMVNSGESLMIEAGASLTVEAGAKIEFGSGSQTEIYGTLTNYGKIINYGTINNYGNIVNYDYQRIPGIINNYGSINNYKNIKNYSVINGGFNNAPIAVITAPEKVLVNTSTTIYGTNSSDEDGLIVHYMWDFGDGDTASNNNGVCSHIYRKTGTYTITLTVEDNESTVNSSTLTLVVADSLEEKTFFSTLTQEGSITENVAEAVSTIAPTSTTSMLNMDFSSLIPPAIAIMILFLVLCIKVKK